MQSCIFFFFFFFKQKTAYEMRVSGVNFLSLLIRNSQGQRVVKGEVFTAKPFETIIDDLAPGLSKRSPADILEYLEHHRALTPAHEIAEVFRISEEDARTRLEKLSKAGLLTEHAFDGISTWRPRSGLAHQCSMSAGAPGRTSCMRPCRWVLRGRYTA